MSEDKPYWESAAEQNVDSVESKSGGKTQQIVPADYIEPDKERFPRAGDKIIVNGNKTVVKFHCGNKAVCLPDNTLAVPDDGRTVPKNASVYVYA